jgi:hypothetical protein
VPSTTGRWAIVEVRSSSGYSGHLVSERKANAAGSRLMKSPIEKQMQGSRLTKCGTRRERKKKIVDVASENTQSMYSNSVASDWLKKVGADRYSGGNIF